MITGAVSVMRSGGYGWQGGDIYDSKSKGRRRESTQELTAVCSAVSSISGKHRRGRTVVGHLHGRRLKKGSVRAFRGFRQGMAQ